MSAVVPVNQVDEGFAIFGAAGANVFNTKAFDCSKSKTASFTISWGAVAATAGTLKFQGTDDPRVISDPGNAVWVDLTVTTFHGSWPTVGATASQALVVLESLPHYVRLVDTQSAGGGANQFKVFAFGRAI